MARKKLSRPELTLKLEQVNALISVYESGIKRLTNELFVEAVLRSDVGERLFEILRDQVANICRIGVATSLIEADLARVANELDLGDAWLQFCRVLPSRSAALVTSQQRSPEEFESDVISLADETLGLLEAMLAPAKQLRSEWIASLDAAEINENQITGKEKRRRRDMAFRRLRKEYPSESHQQLANRAKDIPELKQLGVTISEDTARNAIMPRRRGKSKAKNTRSSPR